MLQCLWHKNFSVMIERTYSQQAACGLPCDIAPITEYFFNMFSRFLCLDFITSMTHRLLDQNDE